MELLNDVHSRLNPTRVLRVERPSTVADVVALVRSAARSGLTISVCGGRHAMGGQQFGEGCVQIDCTGLRSALSFDAERGLLTIEGGADWPTIIDASHAAQGSNLRWGIRQKQTGADHLTLAGAIAANAHGRGLLMQPIGDDIEDCTVVLADGEVVRCSREERPGLFAHVIGGYGLFGIVVAATLRLGPRLRLERLVDILDLDDAMNAIRRRVAEGCLYGDFQYAIEPTDRGFLKRGVMACYREAPAGARVSEGEGDLSRDAWLHLLALAHRDKPRAFTEYAKHYVGTHGRVYWSDSMQLSLYIPAYSEFLLSAGVRHPSEPDESLVIGELYVLPERLVDFMDAARKVLITTGVEDIYGTIRSIRRDRDSALPWAREDFACVIFNLRTTHTPEGVQRTHEAFRLLYDEALSRGGSFFLTYHRAARPDQLRRAYPGLGDFIACKLRYDPQERFQSEWYRHMKGIVPPAATPGTARSAGPRR